jgi:hypothetical protein
VVTACFPDVEHARAAARLYRGCVRDLMRGRRPVPPGRGANPEEIIAAVRTRRAPMMSASAGLRL